MYQKNTYASYYNLEVTKIPIYYNGIVSIF